MEIKVKLFVRLLATILALKTTSFAQQRPIPTLANLDGVVKDEQGVARAATVVAIRNGTKKTVEAGPDGVFHFVNLPLGKYLICSRTAAAVGAKEDSFLDSCTRLDDADTQQVAVGPVAAKQTTVTVTLRRGARMRVRINDTGRQLAAQGAKGKGEGLFVSISGPGGISYPTPVVGEDVDGRDFEVVIPYDKTHKVNVRSTVFVLSDARRQPVADNATVDVQAARGNGNPPVLVFNVERAK
jgi:hypothetical protein